MVIYIFYPTSLQQPKKAVKKSHSMMEMMHAHIVMVYNRHIQKEMTHKY